MPPERLQKVMANSGIASRRACEELITEGRVTVNGEVVRELGTKVDLARDVVEVDGRRVKSKQEKRYTYLMLNKPPGILSVFNDERGRPGLETLITSNNRLYPVGRLDADSEGLLLLTDDGEMTLRLSHPRYEHVKTYYVLLNRAPGTDTLARVRRGIDLGDGTTAPSDWKVIDKPPSVHPLPDTEQPDGAWIRVIMREGKKRQIRRMAASVQDVLQEAIRYEGSTLSDGTYRNALNKAGGYQNAHRVYDREGECCLTCGRSRVIRIVQAQRSTFFCPRCQRIQANARKSTR